MKEIICPKCGKKELWRAGRARGKQQYQCKKCTRKINSRTKLQRRVQKTNNLNIL